MNKRRYLSAAEKSRLIDRQRGKCACGCGEKLEVGKIDYDHILDRWLGGSEALENFCALIRKHHRKKTDANTTIRAKCDRMKAKHEGTFLNFKDRELASLRSRSRQI